MAQFTEIFFLLAVCTGVCRCDPCLPTNPCQNGGTCTMVTDTTYTCACPLSRTGVNCESYYNGNPCSSYPCMNGGACSPVWGSISYNYVCTCTASWTGTRCETANPCNTPFLCGTGGTCIPTPSSPYYICECECGRYGTICESSLGGFKCKKKNACPTGMECKCVGLTMWCEPIVL